MGDEIDPSTGLPANDPDAIVARPPEKVIDAKTYFQVGEHEGKWSEYDERGVPLKNAKKKKPTKKEKEVLETEYLDASKAYQKYLKDVENWEQAKLDSEKALQKSDRLRWSFRQVGQKHDPIDPDEMETIIKLMGWKKLSVREAKVIKKGLTEIASSGGQVELEALRKYVKETMPLQLLEDRLLSGQLDHVELEDLYSPRTWRGKLEADPASKKSKTSPRGSSARKTSSARKGASGNKDGKSSPRGGSGGTSARGASKDGRTSPRGGSSRGGSKGRAAK